MRPCNMPCGQWSGVNVKGFLFLEFILLVNGLGNQTIQLKQKQTKRETDIRSIRFGSMVKHE